jgi:hypothetical protein
LVDRGSVAFRGRVIERPQSFFLFAGLQTPGEA